MGRRRKRGPRSRELNAGTLPLTEGPASTRGDQCSVMVFTAELLRAQAAVPANVTLTVIALDGSCLATVKVNRYLPVVLVVPDLWLSP